MIDPALLAILACPETKQPVRWAEPELIAKLNRLQAEGRLLNRSGAKVSEPLEAGLIREDGRWLYPVVDSIPVMLAGESVSPSVLD